MISNLLVPLANHLWQSTLFAAAMGLLALALRHNQARVRYWLWTAASYKFLLPFSWLVSLGHQFEWHSAPRVMSSALSVHLADAVSGPLFLTSSFSPASVTAERPPAFLFAIGLAWGCGFVFVAARWMTEWMRVRAIVRGASPLALGLPIRAVGTAARLEPGVFGILRPVLLLPEGIEDRLTETQLRAIVAHELCHMRRRDNLTAAIHMLVEALFWFYPPVWWLGARMVDERERACDEEVLQTGGHAEAYAESILKVCEFYLESRLTCVSGVTGSDLKKRIQRIIEERFGAALSAQKKFLLATAGVVALAVPLVAGLLPAPRILAQLAGVPGWQAAAGGKMSFDVASVKPDQTRGRPNTNVQLVGEAYAPTGGLFSAKNIPLMNYMRFAFKDIKLTYQGSTDLGGAPAWVRNDQYDIEAKTQGNPTKDQMRLMVQSVLADRFKLAWHYETKQLPVYALVLSKEGKLGPQLKPSDGACSSTPGDIKTMTTAPQLPPPASSAVSTSQISSIPCGNLMPVPPSAPGRMRIVGRKVTLAYLGEMMGPATGVDRTVIDRTGLSGTFDMDFEFAPVLPPGAPSPPGFTFDPDGPRFAEVIQDALGLKLQPQTGPVDVLVIDHVEQPSAN